ncbi:MAG: hypothetical protein ACE5IB_07480 [Candidatus Geothermarchaeales archaeon]
MVLEVEVGFAIAVLGLSGCILFLFDRNLQARPAPWAGFFLGAFLYIIIHDTTDALLLEPAVRLAYGLPSSLLLAVVGLLLGGGSVSLLLREPSGTDRDWTTVLLFVAIVLALHAALDGIVIAETLRWLAEEEILQPAAIALQVIHRALEGGVIVALMLMARVGKLRIFAVTFYVGLPTVATAAWVPVAPQESLWAMSIFFALVEFGAFLVLLLVGLWPLLSQSGRRVDVARWALGGFLLTLLAHALAH